ncbi:MAG: lytic transglycosylase domain-containing protein [Pseudomonadota bacterium]
MHRPFLLLFLCLFAGLGHARAPDPLRISALCEAAGAYAARAHGVPETVMRAIALTETGRIMDGHNRPWPWTVNMEGTGKWFATRDEALAYVKAHHAKGARSFDVGCFQINFRWHGSAFASIEQMFDPRENALYASRFLRSLFAESQSWITSAGAYHSRTPKFATRYSKRFERILAGLTGGAAPPPAVGEYAHNMTDAEGMSDMLDGVRDRPARRVRRPAKPGPLFADVPPRWVAPPPSATGSLAAIDHLPSGPGLLTPARGGLYGGTSP